MTGRGAPRPDSGADAPTVALRPARPRLHEIDLLRIIAALAVVLYHYLFSGAAGKLTTVAYPEVDQIARYGYLGVDLFFVISGFVVLMSAWQRSPGKFLISRIVRLYPAYWVAVTLTAVLTVLIGAPHFFVSAWQYVTNMTMFNSLVNAQNVDVVYWTLWSELRFYAIVLVFTVIGMTRRRVLTALWIWLAAIAVMEVLPAGRIATIADLVVQSQFAHYFIAGMALFLLHRFGPSIEVVLIIVLSLANAVFRGIGFADAVAQRYTITLDAGVITGIIVVIFVVMGLVATGVTRPLARPGFALAGSLTYPLYLIHAYIGFMLFNLLADKVDRWLLVVGLVATMLLSAYGIHRLVEQPLAPRISKLLTRLVVRKDARPAAPAEQQEPNPRPVGPSEARTEELPRQPRRARRG